MLFTIASLQSYQGWSCAGVSPRAAVCLDVLLELVLLISVLQ